MHTRVASLLVLLLVLVGCGGGSDSTGPARVASIVISGAPNAVLTGETVQLTASAKDTRGAVVAGRAVAWSTTTPAVASVSQSGRLTGLTVGAAVVTATLDGKVATARIDVRPVPVASVLISPKPATTREGGTYQLNAVARDSIGNPLVDRAIAWTSRDTLIATVSASGLVTGRAAGQTFIVGAVEGKADSTTLTVASAATPHIASISPAVLTPGGPATIVGANFDPTPGGNSITIDGVGATVTAAASDRLEVLIPATGFACAPTRPAMVAITAGGLTGTAQHPLQVATQRTLGVGEALMLSAGDGRCNELAQTGGRYLVSVHNTATVISETSVEVRGAAATALMASAAPPVPAAQLPARSLGFRPALAFDVGAAALAERAPDIHDRLLDESRELAKRVGARRSIRGAAVRPSVSGAPLATGVAAEPTVGEVVSMKVANLKAPAGTIACSQPIDVRARVVYVGTRSIVLEDETAPLVGTMDAYYERIGREFDERMIGILEQNFGNPVAYASALDNDARITMLFTPHVNTFEGIAGFVYACDFFAPVPGDTILRASNQSEVFYARVPTSPATGYSGDTKDNWLWSMRSTVIHEVKHLTSYAERFSRTPADQPVRLEQSWLEEGTARHSEELYARSYSGVAWKGNATHAQTVFCEVRPTGAGGCELERPLALAKHFGAGGLYTYYTEPYARSPLGSVVAKDNSFYGSAWMLVRWAIDQFAPVEADFLRGLTQDHTRTGVANLEARAGRGWADMIPEWSLALALDDHPAGPPVNPRLSIPSFQTRDLFAGLASDFPTTYAASFPLAVRQLPYGDFTAPMTITSGSSAYLEISGTQSAKQLLEMRTASGATPPAAMRVSIVRVQ